MTRTGCSGIGSSVQPVHNLTQKFSGKPAVLTERSDRIKSGQPNSGMHSSTVIIIIILISGGPVSISSVMIPVPS